MSLLSVCWMLGRSVGQSVIKRTGGCNTKLSSEHLFQYKPIDTEYYTPNEVYESGDKQDCHRVEKVGGKQGSIIHTYS